MIPRALVLILLVCACLAQESVDPARPACEAVRALLAAIVLAHSLSPFAPRQTLVPLAIRAWVPAEDAPAGRETIGQSLWIVGPSLRAQAAFVKLPASIPLSEQPERPLHHAPAVMSPPLAWFHVRLQSLPAQRISIAR